MRVKYINRFLLIILLFFSFISTSIACDKKLCEGQNATFMCLKKNFTELYSDNYELFWKILHKAANKLQKSGNISDITDFMELVLIINSNAEVSEYFGEISEKFCVSNPEICLNAMISLDENAKISFIKRLQHPIYLSNEEITQIFLKYKNIERYKEIVEYYFISQKAK